MEKERGMADGVDKNDIENMLEILDSFARGFAQYPIILHIKRRNRYVQLLSSHLSGRAALLYV